MDRADGRLEKDALFSRLAEGLAAGVTVLTPNRRLAQSLAREFGERQAARGLRAWETPDILPFAAFVERLWGDALHSDSGASIPALLSEAQEQILWEECIHASGLGAGLLSVPAAALQCHEAWQLLHAWRMRDRIEAAARHDDATTFVAWLGRYEAATRKRRCTDAARLPDAVAPVLGTGKVREPACVVAFGFDLLTPQQRAFFQALEAARVTVLTSRAAPRRSSATRLAFASSREEIAACARWVRARLESGASRIGIVVPDLARLRSRIARSLTDVLDPGRRLPGAAKGALAFNVSLGIALGNDPLVHDALLVLRLCGREIGFDALSRVVRSPFLGGAETERVKRARLDAELRQRAAVRTSLDAVRRLMDLPGVPRAPQLQARFRQLADLRRKRFAGSSRPSVWAQAITEALRIAGFPGERGLDSAEYQALAKWHETLCAFATLDRVTKSIGYEAALERLAALAAQTLFQPRAADAPVQVLGVLESAGLEFDHLWVLGLTDEAWPLAERAHPFIPIRLQREAGVPQAEVDASLEIDRKLTQGWLGSAGEVVMSHALAESDRELFVSPLITGVPEGRLEDLRVPQYDRLRDAIHRAGSAECVEDRHAPPIPAAAQPGGTALFKDQSACPFRGFAHHRVNSRPLESPAPGIDARERGKLLHAALAAVWEELRDSARLAALGETERAAVLERAADAAIGRVRERRPDALTGRFGEMERARLVAHLGEWLAFERGRAEFSVVATERKAPMAFGSVEVQARVDRIDSLAGAGHAVIDYKTGEARVAEWLGERPEDPQLPMYALSGENVDAVVFARVKAGEFCFAGLARRDGLLPGVSTIDRNRTKLARDYRDWDALVAGWRRELEAIGRGFASGDALVDPKHGRETCERCDQATFCRVSERFPSAGDEDNGNAP